MLRSREFSNVFIKDEGLNPTGSASMPPSRVWCLSFGIYCAPISGTFDRQAIP